MRYRSKPTEIEAIHWTGDNLEDVLAFLGDGLQSVGPDRNSVRCVRFWTANDQVVTAWPGDWIIAEPVPGKFYPCKPEIFEARYEPVPDTPWGPFVGMKICAECGDKRCPHAHDLAIPCQAQAVQAPPDPLEASRAACNACDGSCGVCPYGGQFV